MHDIIFEMYYITISPGGDEQIITTANTLNAKNSVFSENGGTYQYLGSLQNRNVHRVLGLYY